MLTRINNAYTAAIPGLAGLAPLGIVYFRGGTNDARALSTIASIQGAYTSLLQAIKAYCERVIILSVPPIGSADGGDYATKNARTQDYNAWLSAYAAANSDSFTFVDDSAALRNPDGSQIASYFQDGVHNNGHATLREGIDGAAALQSMFDAWGYSSPLSTDPADVYPAQPQWNTAHLMAGSSGSVGAGFTGQMATGWSVGRTGSAIDFTSAAIVEASIVATNGNDTGQMYFAPSGLTLAVIA